MPAELAVPSRDTFPVPPRTLPATSTMLTLAGGTIVHDGLTSPGMLP